ncbi:MAG: hypothetical protein Q8O10_01095 [candidate division Zixibacteria bacterium]|nr:hypothetical protein [candidate division Zixibacteria bacterium]
MMAFFILGVQFIALTYRYSTYLNAQLLVDKVFNGIKPKDLKRYVFHFYKVPEPAEWEFTTPEFRTLLFRQKLIKEELTEEKEKEHEKEIANFKLKLEEYKSFMKDVNELSKKGKINDPFSIVVDMSAKALLNHDLIAWRLIHDELVKLIEGWLKNEVLGEFETQKSIRKQSWDPYFYLSKLLVLHLSFMKEVVITSGHPSLLLDIILTSKNLANRFASFGSNWKAVLELISFMKKLGKELIETERVEAIHPIFDAIGELSEQSIQQKEKEFLGEICCSIGWLGEHLIMKGIAIEPLMSNEDEIGHLDSLISCIVNIRDSLIREKLVTFSLAYYDAIEVIMMRLVDVSNQKRTFEDTISTIVYCIAKCGKEAAKLGDSAILSHSVFWLRRICNKTRDVNYFKRLPREIVYNLAIIGAIAARYNKPAKGLGGDEKDQIDIVIREIIEITDIDNLNYAIQELYSREFEGRDDKSVWTFIIRLGKECHSNFGLKFDWNTGETYAQDDPRRERIDRF